MPQAAMTREHMLRIYEAVAASGNIKDAAKACGLAYTTVTKTYRRAMDELGLPEVRRELRALRAMGVTQASVAVPYEAPILNAQEEAWPIQNGTVLAFGDSHWTHPHQPRSVAHEALLTVLADIAPTVLLHLGDAMDFADISRHDPIGWQQKPKVKDEIEAARMHLGDLREKAPGAKCFWAIGNHDERFDSYLARNAAQFEGEEGFRLADRFSDWRLAYRWNLGAFYAFHRWHSGIHAAYNNTLKAGYSTVSGDTHRAKISSWDDLRGRRYGVEVGMLADPHWPAFHYLRGKPTPWAAGWVVLTVHQGQLLQPETCEVIDGVAWFRGKPIAGRPRVRVQAGRAA